MSCAFESTSVVSKDVTNTYWKRQLCPSQLFTVKLYLTASSSIKKNSQTNSLKQTYAPGIDSVFFLDLFNYAETKTKCIFEWVYEFFKLYCTNV